MKFKYLWIITLGVPYVVWTFKVLKGMIYRKFFKREAEFYYTRQEDAWMTAHLICFGFLGLISFAAWCAGFWEV